MGITPRQKPLDYQTHCTAVDEINTAIDSVQVLQVLEGFSVWQSGWFLVS